MKRLVPIICILLLGKLPLLSQEPYKINFTTENGLPSNEVYCAYQDTSGFMWFGTENGVSRYDGYAFQNFGLEDGLEQLEINQIIKDQTGKVWFSSFYGKVFYCENDRFYPYKYNALLQKYRDLADLVNLQHIDEDGNFYFRVKYKGILIIDNNGQEKLIRPDCGVCEVIYRTKSGYTLSEYVSNEGHPKYFSQRLQANQSGNKVVYIFEYNNAIPLIFTPKEKFNSNNCQVLLWNDNIYLYTFYKYVYSIEGINHKKVIKVNAPINYFYKEKDDLFLGLQKNGGLQIFRNWSPNHMEKVIPENWLQDTEVSYIIRDKNQGLWVTTINEGIYYFPNDRIKVFKTNATQKNQKITALYPSTRGSAYGISFDGHLFLAKGRNLGWNLLVNDCNNAHDLVNIQGSFFFKRHHITPLNKIISNSLLFPSRFEKKIKSDIFFASDRFYLFQFNPVSQNFDVIIDEKNNIDHIFDLYRDQNQLLWLATNKGLKTYSNKMLKKVLPEIAHLKTTSIDQLKNRSMVIGTKGKGIFILDHSHTIIKNITSLDGLRSDMIEYVWVDNSDQIWAATLKGLHKIKLDKDCKPTIRLYQKYHGLSSEEIQMVRTYENEVWVATGDGLNHFTDYETDTTTYIPTLISFKVNGVMLQEFHHLNHNENMISISVRNFDLALGNAVSYRYKLASGVPWTMQPSQVFNFLNLNPGQYQLEIQAKNKDGYWSKSLVVPFYIRKPWWATWYFRIFVLLAIGSLIYLYFKKRLENINAAHKLKSQLLSYEKKALLAQMNPHFIFNAFSAIQYYINTHDIKKADDFLADFSSLIRKILDTSFKSDVTLAAELSIVQLYISLEQKRFDHSFDCEYFIDDDLDMDTMMLPPMLVQPLVENAINHGIIPMQNRKGLLRIHITENGNNTCIKVSDNGIGMQNTTTHQKTDHQSYGLQIIHDRINSYNKSGEYVISLHHEATFSNEKMPGTTFELKITRAGL